VTDIRGNETWQRVEEHFRRLHEPQFGRPHRLLEITAGADASQVAVTGLVYDELDGLPRQVAYRLVDGELVPLGETSSSTRQPKLSPDGSRVLVLSDANEKGVFQLVVDGVAAPEVPGTIEYADWSPDGCRVLLGVAGRGADLSGGQGSGTTKAVAEDLPAWHPTVDAGASEESWRSLWVFDVETQELTRWSPPHVNVWESAWFGQDALVVASPAPDEGAWYTATLQRLSSDGTLATLYTPQVQLGWPSASPAGSSYAVVEAVCSDRWVVAGDLLVSSGGAEPERVDTLGVDVTTTRWIDAGRIGLAGIRGLETVVAIHDVAAQKTTEVWSSTETSCGTRHPEVAWTGDGRCVLVEEGYAQPQRIISLTDGDPQVLLETANDGTAYLLGVAGSAEAVAWSAPDGTRIEGILCTPSGEGPHPLIINIHGGPVWSFRNLWSMFYAWTPVFVAAGYAVLSPNPRGSSGRGQDFARQVFGDMGGADTHDFTSAVDALVERGIVDPARVGLTGGSYGGYMSSWLVTQDQRWAAAVPVSPVTNWYSQHFTSNIPYFDALFLDGDPEVPGDKFHSRSPVAHASKVTTPCLNIAGALDRCTPPTQAQEFHQALLEHGVESQLAIYPQEGHGVRSFPALTDFCSRVLGWFETHMPATR